MTLNAYASQKRLALFEELRDGREPSEGVYEAALLREARTKGEPQVGATRYEPRAIILEFIYPDPNGATVVLPVRLDPPERIVFLPVPPWVVETIWQGEIAGSAHFESDARALLEAFQDELAPEANEKWFEATPPTGRA